ncbi:VOC family metalloprotein YjdN [Enterobacter sp. Bisph1]|uniref:VOC family metalloprotein YjdN n=1 Tax=Enterobacter sp. Bisph1 TaxID=1274399 RepID=UPI00057C16E4|nr:VOC family metalloprotein YjdN [Enterobacter sp. Bisph1]
MPLTPYISFSGQCEQAIAFYQQALKAELTYKITFGEMPKSEQESSADEGCAAGQAFADNDIAHAALRIAGSEIMMSDGRQNQADYSGFTLSLTTEDVAQGKIWFDALAAEGRVTMAWQETFWAHGFGMVTDKFGIPWMVNVVKASPAA